MSDPFHPCRRCAVTLLTAALALGACDTDDGADRAEPFEQALPDFALLEFDIPTLDLTIAPLTGASDVGVQPAPLGEPSAARVKAAAVLETVNASLDRLTAPIRDVIKHHRPTFSTPDRAVWRGRVGNIDPDVYLLVVQREAGGFFSFTGLSRDADTPGAWRLRFFGEMSPSGATGRGSGAIWVDFDTDRDPDTIGRALATWTDGPERREVAVDLFGVAVKGGAGRTQAHRFAHNADGSGIWDYGPFLVDVNADNPAKDKLETAGSVLRWAPEGAGRLDISARGGDVADDGLVLAVISECWAPDGRSTYEAVHGRTRPGDALMLLREDGVVARCPVRAPRVSAARAPTDTMPTPTLPAEAQPTPSANGAR